MHCPLLRHGPLKSNVYTPQRPFYTQHHYLPKHSVMQQQQQQHRSHSWKRNHSTNTSSLFLSQPERPPSDDFLFLADSNTGGGFPLLSVVFPPHDTATTKVQICDIKPSPLPVTMKPFSSLYYRDPLVTTSKTPLLDSSNMDMKTARKIIHSNTQKRPDATLGEAYSLSVIYQPTYLDQQHISSTIYHYSQQRPSRPPERYQQVCSVPHDQLPSTISHRSSQRGTFQQGNLDNHPPTHYSPPSSYYDHPSTAITGRHPYSIHQTQHKPHHRYQDSGMDHSYSDDRNHRRISNNTDASTSTRSSSTPRRFSSSSSSTSSKSTLASSMGSISHWNDHDAILIIDVTKQERCISLPADNAQTTTARTTPRNKSMNVESINDQSSDLVHDDQQQQKQQQQQSTLSSSTSCIPIWADPIKIRDNPTRYKIIQDYTMKNKIPNTSPLPFHHPVVFYASGGTTTTSNYRSHLRILFTSETMWSFGSRWKHHKIQHAPSQLAIHQTVYCFQKGVEPMWEDKLNINGGRLTLILTNTLEDDLFDWMLCTFIGGNLVLNGCVGLVFSKRAKADRIELWLDASSGHHDRIASLRQKLLGLLPANYHPPILASIYRKHYRN